MRGIGGEPPVVETPSRIVQKMRKQISELRLQNNGTELDSSVP